MIEMLSMVRCVILHIPNIRLGLCLENTQDACNPECLVPSVKRGGRSAMICTGLSWYSAGPVITLNGQITAGDYMLILGNDAHPVVQ